MKVETSRNVTKSKRSLHWCRSISKKISVQVLLQYQSKSYYIIGQEVYYSIWRCYYIIGQLLHYRAFFYYIIGHVLQYRAFITLSVCTNVTVHSGPGHESAYFELSLIDAPTSRVTTDTSRVWVTLISIESVVKTNKFIFSLRMPEPSLPNGSLSSKPTKKENKKKCTSSSQAKLIKV